MISAALAGLFPEDPPLFLARTPYGYNDVAAIRADLAAAGLGPVGIEVVASQSTAASSDLSARFSATSPV